ncbi:flagellar basal-body MS-ring/collar protein FliF [Mesobacillus maritimus]|uniref:flagellar basal-body MS-ring/collar protein FliF n=1 Tax=Mesobacillus maritimus TaxID=1643336 RepID=UPI00384EB90D
MKEKLLRFKSKAVETWSSFSGKTKWSLVGTFVVTLVILSVFVYMASKPNLTPLYSGLSPSEAGEIKAAIEERGIMVEVSPDGKSISVPNEQVSNLKVALAAEGIPKSGNVNYSIFSENMGLGMTDRQFDVVERDAMQNELATLIKQIAGVSEANVMITLPKENIWITDEAQVATASVVIKGEPSFQLEQKQVNGLYHLISKSVPNLPTDEIVIMGQNGQIYAMQDEGPADTTFSVYQEQREIRKDIEQDIQRELQQMLGLLLGRDKVVVSVMASVDFTKEKREEQLVEPVIDENNQGIDISVERIIESYSSEGGVVNDATSTGNTDIANYPGVDGVGNSESERTEERINREVNRIHRQIELSPYVIDDLTINVGVEPPIPNTPASLTQQNMDDIRNLLTNVVSNSLSMNGALMTDEDLQNRISVFATEFQGKQVVVEETEPPLFDQLSNVPMMIGAGIAVLLIILMIAGFLRRRKRKKEEEEFLLDLYEEPMAQVNQAEEEEIDLSELSSKTNPKRKTIEKLAKERPEDFAKLLRSWMAQD